jgi:hypothetical protein
MKATLSLFNALPIKEKCTKIDTELMHRTIKYGFIFSPEVVANYDDYDKLIGMVREVFGLSAEELNSTFHKSWAKVKNTPLEQLAVEQIAHYLTTYGKEDPTRYALEKELQWGIDDLSAKIADLDDIELDRAGEEGYVYIPKEALKIPGIEMDSIKLVVIRGYTIDELKEKLLQLLESGIALKENTVKAVVEVATFVGLDDLTRVKNKEVRAHLYEHLGLVPTDPVEFLRYAVFAATGSALLIKSSDLIRSIRIGDVTRATLLFQKYEQQYGFSPLAQIFYRFKPIFLAFRTNSVMRSYTNTIRRLAVKYHTPMPEDYLNTVTARLTRSGGVSHSRLKAELDKATTFRKVRLAYALNYRLRSRSNSILYRIRNGKGYATELPVRNPSGAAELGIVLDSIAQDIEKNVSGKKIYIPDYISYSLPATEKQFTGNIPAGSSITLDRMLVGIHWENIGHRRIDLDLSMVAIGEKVGWDARYRTSKADVLFSGDMTDAAGGATETFFIGKQPEKAFLVLVNYYNYDGSTVPYKIFVARALGGKFGLPKNYTVDPNRVILTSPSTIDKQQRVIGLVVADKDEIKFYFAEAVVGRSITSRDSESIHHTRQYLRDFYENPISLRSVLTAAGAELVDDLDQADIDLSPEAVDKNSFLEILG